MKNAKYIFGLTGAVALCLIACEIDYQSIRASRTRNTKHKAEKMHYLNTNTTVTFPPGEEQLLIFSGDTMTIARNDTVIERLISYHSKGWVGARKKGLVLFEGYTKKGRKSLRIQMLDPQNPSTGGLILSPVMSGDYDEALDTVRTYYQRQL